MPRPEICIGPKLATPDVSTDKPDRREIPNIPIGIPGIKPSVPEVPVTIPQETPVPIKR